MKKSKQQIESRVSDLLAQLTVEEKVSLCHACSSFTIPAIPRLGIPELYMSDGPHGIREELQRDSWLSAGRDDDQCTYMPVGVALAATWNPKMAAKFGKVLGEEARDRGKDVMLSVGINIVRTPLCGRNFEYYSEDPCLVAKMVVPITRAIQKCDVAACVKHFAVNNQELGRLAVDTLVDERTLRELYLPGFQAAVQKGGALTVMGAYNKFRGRHCCHNDYLLNKVLKKEWRFKGAVISDWGGVHDTNEAIHDGLDVEMGTMKWENDYLGAAFLEAVKKDKAALKALDDKVRRVLRVMVLIGMLDDTRAPGSRNTKAHQQAARKIAAEAMVLLKNKDGLLPFDLSKIKTLAVIGDNADKKMAAGGGSSGVKALYEVTPLEALRKRVGKKINLLYVKGYPILDNWPLISIEMEQMGYADTVAGLRGWRGEYFNSLDFSGAPAAVRTDPEINFAWYETAPTVNLAPWAGYSCRWTGTLHPTVTGKYQLGVRNNNTVRVFVNDAQVLENGKHKQPQVRQAEIALTAGAAYQIRIEFIKDQIDAELLLGWLPPNVPAPKETDSYAEALAAARAADAVLFIAGLNHRFDTEGKDRPHMKLPDGQDRLIRAVVEANPRTAVFLIGGSPVEMPWIDEAAAVVQVWYAGCEGGHALADVAFGRVNPSGKLPVTFPRRLEETPVNVYGEYNDTCVEYKEGLMVGYRYYDTKKVEPLFPFGHGLSYTTFAYDDLVIEPAPGGKDGVVQVSVDVKNTGPRPGAEVVQLYIRDEEAAVLRPFKELKGFEKIQLRPGQTRTVRFLITKRDLSFYEVKSGKWTAEPGAFTVLVGSSSRDIRVQARFDIDADGAAIPRS
jgi:beta-glucosidase